MKKKILISFLILAAIVRPLMQVAELKDKFFSGDYAARYDDLRVAYENSQYVKRDNPNIILDETLESYAAGAFLRGVNPILIVHDQPPLGRYIIALSIMLFDNQHTLILALVAAAVIGLFLVARMIVQNSTLAFVPLVIFLNEPRFLSMFKVTPLLETIQFPFIIFALFFFMKAILAKQPFVWFLLTSLMIGCVISIRFFIVGLILIACLVFYLLLKRHMRNILLFLISAPLSLVVLILSYTKTIQEGYRWTQVFGIQTYILFYHQSKFVLPLSFWDLLLFNRWHTWWGDRSISFDPQWIITWPIATVLTAFSALLAVFKKMKLGPAETVLILWVLLYSLSLSTGYTSTRYFLPLVPFLYILAFAFIMRFIRRFT